MLRAKITRAAPAATELENDRFALVRARGETPAVLAARLSHLMQKVGGGAITPRAGAVSMAGAERPAQMMKALRYTLDGFSREGPTGRRPATSPRRSTRPWTRPCRRPARSARRSAARTFSSPISRWSIWRGGACIAPRSWFSSATTKPFPQDPNGRGDGPHRGGMRLRHPRKGRRGDGGGRRASAWPSTSPAAPSSAPTMPSAMLGLVRPPSRTSAWLSCCSNFTKRRHRGPGHRRPPHPGAPRRWVRARYCLDDFSMGHRPWPRTSCCWTC